MDRGSNEVDRESVLVDQGSLVVDRGSKEVDRESVLVDQ